MNRREESWIESAGAVIIFFIAFTAAVILTGLW